MKHIGRAEFCRAVYHGVRVQDTILTQLNIVSDDREGADAHSGCKLRRGGNRGTRMNCGGANFFDSNSLKYGGGFSTVGFPFTHLHNIFASAPISPSTNTFPSNFQKSPLQYTTDIPIPN